MHWRLSSHRRVPGASLEVDGVTWNPVDPARVRELMVAVAAATA